MFGFSKKPVPQDSDPNRMLVSKTSGSAAGVRVGVGRGSDQTTDPRGVLVGSCETAAGGFKKPSVAAVTPVVSNAEDDIWRDEDFSPVQEGTYEVILIDTI